MARDFHILTLDGGGAWAIIEVMALIDAFGAKITGHQVLRHFDLIASNSGGSIVLGGLVMDMPLSVLRDLFVDPTANRRSALFHRTSFWSDPLSHITQWLAKVGPKYDARRKRQTIGEILGAYADRPMSSLPGLIGIGEHGREPHVVICGFDYDINRAKFFRSDLQSLAGSFGAHSDIGLADAVHSSSEAPVNFFNAPAEVPQPQTHSARYWDGAVGGYNNPVLAAVIETIANAARYDTTRDQIKVLSIGTASIVLPWSRGAPFQDPIFVVQQSKPKLTADLRKLATSILDDPPDVASFHAHVLLGAPIPANSSQVIGNGPIVRMNPAIRPLLKPNGRWVTPPGLTNCEFNSLTLLDTDAVRQWEVALIEKLGKAWLSDQVFNQPIRANGDTLDAEIGHNFYKDAKQQARAFGLI